MSRKRGKTERVGSLLGTIGAEGKFGELDSYYKQCLSRGLYGLGFSPYVSGQKPGDQLSEEQVRRRLEIIKPYAGWVRSFSCTEGNEWIPKLAKSMGLKTLVGAWLGKDLEKNEIEIHALIKMAKEGFVDLAAIGNEVLYRKELSEEALLAYMRRVKKEIPEISIGYVDAYYEFENRPALVDACDVIMANCYPFWEGCHINYAHLYMKDMYHRAQKASMGKPVIISETGWPNKGMAFHGAEPSEENAKRYFVDAQSWALEEEIPLFYFSSFDESWKTGDEGDVGAYWGLWDEQEKLKYV